MTSNCHHLSRLVFACLLACLAHALCVGVVFADAADDGRAGVLQPGHAQQTPYFVIETNEPGPTVLIVGGIHGNEPAGAVAAEQIRHWRITRGRMVVIPRANPLSLEANQRLIPGKPQGQRDLNRNFPRADHPDEPPRGDTATALWSFITELKPDWILDLHEGIDFHIVNNSSVGSSIIYAAEPGTAPYATRMLAVVNAEVNDPEKLFIPLARGPVDSGMVRAAIAHLSARGMILETTSRGQPLSLRVRQHRLMVHRFLTDIDMLDHGPHVMLPQMMQLGDNDAVEMVRVAVYDGPGTGGGASLLVRIFEQLPNTVAMAIGPADIRDDALDQFHAVVFPGGRGGAQGTALGDVGRDKVRAFVHGGGGYVGICAGAYLPTCRLETYLKMVRVYHHRPWQTGKGRVEVELTEHGKTLLDVPQDTGVLNVRYNNGPLFFHEDGLVPDESYDAVPFEVVAYFRSATTRNERVQTMMIDTPAIVSAEYGRGRMILISPHPESDADLRWMVQQALRWTANHAAAEMMISE